MDLVQIPYTTVSTTIKESQSDDVGVMAPGDGEAFARLVSAFYGIICVVGITGNLMVAIVLLRVKSLRSTTSDFLVHLSFVDFMVSVLVIPSFLAARPDALSNRGFFGELWCRFYTSEFLFWLFTAVCVFCLITVNLERYAAIVYPHKYKQLFTKRNKYVMIVACWVLAIVTRSYFLFLYGLDEVNGCLFLGWPNEAAQVAFGLYSFAANLVLPFAVMVFAQTRVISTLNRQLKMLTERTTSTGVTPNDRREMWQLRASKTLVKTLLACVVTFAVCWTPNQVWFLLFNFGIPMNPGGHFHLLTIILAVGNSCVNPIIYTLTNKPFRKGIREVFCKERDSNRVHESGTSAVTLSANVSM